MASPLNTDDIKQCMPHRDPFLWLDEVTEISENHIVARKLLSADLPVFQDNGRFSADKYKQLLAGQNMTPQMFYSFRARRGDRPPCAGDHFFF